MGFWDAPWSGPQTGYHTAFFTYRRGFQPRGPRGQIARRAAKRKTLYGIKNKRLGRPGEDIRQRELLAAKGGSFSTFRHSVSMGLLIWALSVTASGTSPAFARVDYDRWHAAGAPSRVHFKVSRDRVVELVGLSSSCGISVTQLGPMDTVSGTVVKTNFADDAIAIAGFVLQENTGVRRYFNSYSDALTYLGNADSGWVMQGLQMFLRGRWCRRCPPHRPVA
jgi:hypothetical protein